MAVKRSRSAARMLEVFEAISRSQPIGVSALARQLGADKSAVQRDLMTLADAGWIGPAPAATGQWELTPHVMTLARPPQSSDSLRQRARPVLEALRLATGETVYLTVPHGDHFVVIDAFESLHLLRTVAPIGIVVPIEGSATARAFLPHLSEAAQKVMLGGAPDRARLAEIADTRRRGYAVSAGDVTSGATALAAAILDGKGHPVGALVVTGPSERLEAERRTQIGERLREAAAQLTQG